MLQIVFNHLDIIKSDHAFILGPQTIVHLLVYLLGGVNEAVERIHHFMGVICLHRLLHLVSQKFFLIIHELVRALHEHVKQPSLVVLILRN